MRKVLSYLILLQSCILMAQSPYTIVREKLEKHDLVFAGRIIDSCEKLSYMPDSTLFYKGLHCLKAGKLKKATDIRSALEKKYPSFGEVHYLNGLIFFMEKNYGKSIQEFNEVLKNNPENLKVLYNRALACGLLEDYENAIADLNKYIGIFPNNSQVYYSRAYWCELSGKFSQAVTDYETTIKMDPKNYEAYLGLANVYHIQENSAKACETLSKAIQEGSQMAVEASLLICK